jgi:chromosome partitioning protein
MNRIAVANQKGGCAKTTTTINLAGAIANLGKKVLIIDLDPQAHATFGLGIRNQASEKSIYNVLTDNEEKKKSITECIVNAAQNIDIIPSNILLSTLEQELKDTEGAVSKLHEAIYSATLDYDYIITDCPPSLGFLTFNALRASELVIVPVDMSAFSLMGVGKLLGMIELIKINIGHSPAVKALPTLFDKRLTYSQTMLDEIKSFFKEQTLETVIRLNVTLRKAAAKGVTVIQFDKKSNGALDHTALAKEIIRMEGAEEFKKALAECAASRQQPCAPEKEEISLPVPARIPAIQPVAEPVDRETAFQISAPNARDVYIVGDFNHWKINDASRLSRSEDGRWEKRYTLAPGKYRYKFVVDGEWVLDSANQEKEQNPYGTFDSVKQLA